MAERNRRKRLPAPGDGFGARLKKLREDRGLTQVQLAEAAGTIPRNISHYEGGLAWPMAATLSALARVLEVSADELLGLTRARALPAMDPETKLLWKRFQVLRRIPEKDRRAILRLLATADRASQALRR